MKKKLLALLLCGLMIIPAMVSTISAADEVGEPAPAEPVVEEPGEGEKQDEEKGFKLDAPVSITITLKDPRYGRTLDGVPVYLWKVADINPDKNTGTFNPGMFLAKDKFKDVWDAAGALKTAKDWDAIANRLTDTLRRYIDENSVPADQAARVQWTGSGASTTFTEFRDGSVMTPGLYLIRVPRYEDTVYNGYLSTTYTYTFQPALIMLPGGYWNQDDVWTPYTGNMFQLEMTVLTDFEWTFTDNELTPKVAVETRIVEDETETDETETPPPETTPPPPETTPETTPTPPPPPPPPPPEEVPDEPVPDEEVPLVYPPDEEIPEEPTPLEPPPEDEEIPDEPIPLTGLLWWPVPVFGVGGLGCIGVGSLIIGKSKKDDEE